MRFSKLIKGASVVAGLGVAVVAGQAGASYESSDEYYEGSSGATVSGATTAASLVSAKQSSSLVSNRISAFTGGAFGGAPGAQTGMLGWTQGGGAAGGKTAPKLGVWGDLGYTAFKDSSTVTQSNGSVWTGAFGADYLVHPKVMIGVAGTVEGVSGSSDATRTNFDSKGVGITPYAAVKITDIFSASVLFGYAWGEVDMSRSTTVGDMAGATTSTRLTTAGTVSANTNFGNFTFGGDLGLSYTDISQDGFWMTGSALNQYVGDSNTELGTLSISAQPGYLIELDRGSNTWIEPYAKFGYSYDFINTDIAGHPNDDDAFTVGAGMNVFTDSNVALSAGASTELGRENYTGVSANLTARVSF